MTTSSSSFSLSSTSPEWPPTSLVGSDVESVRQMTESLEAAGSIDPVTLQVQMVSLLYLGDTSSCRHLYRRHRDDEELRRVLQPWWIVAAAMMNTMTTTTTTTTFDGTTATATTTTVWQALEGVQKSFDKDDGSSSNVLPVTRYVHDIAQAYRLRILYPFVKIMKQNTTIPMFMVHVLGFGSMDEVKTFCQQYFGDSTQYHHHHHHHHHHPMSRKEQSTMDLFTDQQATVLAFLESYLAL